MLMKYINFMTALSSYLLPIQTKSVPSWIFRDQDKIKRIEKIFTIDVEGSSSCLCSPGSTSTFSTCSCFCWFSLSCYSGIFIPPSQIFKMTSNAQAFLPRSICSLELPVVSSFTSDPNAEMSIKRLWNHYLEFVHKAVYWNNQWFWALRPPF